MNKILITILASMLMFLPLFSSEIDMSIFGGLSTPNDRINSVYRDNDDAWELFNKGINLGWHLGTKLRIPVESGLMFTAGFGWNRFSEVQINASKIENDTTYQIKARHDIIPISAGLQYYITDNVVKLYVRGELAYNYFTTHGEFIGLPAPNFDLSDAAGRAGFAAGIGLEFAVPVFQPFIEINYALPNLIGKSSGEGNKYYFNLSIGIIL